MGQNERREIILERLKADHHLSVAELADDLSVSTVTIRKDLKAFEERGLLFRTHGGASLRNPFATDRPTHEKAVIQTDEKARIGKASANLVETRDAVLLSTGTTVFQVARHLAQRGDGRALTLLTSSLEGAIELARIPDAQVIIIGGLVRPLSASVVGPLSTDFLTDYACDKLFLGVDGFDLEFGLTTTSALQAQLDRAMIQTSRQTIIVADSTKFGRRSFCQIAAADEADLVVTDRGVNPDVVRAIEGRGIEVLVV